ncbi:alpha/beta hydrolase [Streptomyces profundus]|uniref:alpha/beta hydrolase n=1 Tax=Streptomyces profundus TaxID=2867410 RepID=UPI001D167BF2|nr:alpha/beta hydrolase [Streptomyces sp. MA3_2.13]UED84316.1 alpha/beta fold hydrolase [Streptomyces sp. MA3_2.13]
MPGGGIRTVVTLAVAALLVAGCSGSPPPQDPGDPTPQDAAPASPEPRDEVLPPLPERLTEQTVDWGACPAPSPLQGSGDPPGDPWRCGTLTVPVDYAEPEGDTVELALIMAPATDPRSRIGSLVFNFGGPGGSGVASLPRSADRYETLGAAYDLVSLDPRGVGESAGVVCRDDDELDRAAQEYPGPPRTQDEERELLAANRDYAADCAERNGELLAHVGTVDAARDLDLLRRALGDEQLHYFGVSYGTRLGAAYAHLFPRRAGRTVLDAVVDPTRGHAERLLLQAEGFQLALDNYLDHCAIVVSDCPTGEGGAAGHATLTALFDQLRATPLPTESGRHLTQDLAITGVLSALYSQGSWSYLTDAIRQAREDGRGDLLLRAAERYNGRDSEGRYRNLSSANTAVNCADFASRPTVATVDEQRDAFLAASPVFGERLLWGLLSCADWPVVGDREQPPVAADGAGPILLLATTGDPATPYAGAERMREELGAGVGVLLTYEGEGHGAFGGGDSCVTDAVLAYLLAGTAPADGTVC